MPEEAALEPEEAKSEEVVSENRRSFRTRRNKI